MTKTRIFAVKRNPKAHANNRRITTTTTIRSIGNKKAVSRKEKTQKEAPKPDAFCDSRVSTSQIGNKVWLVKLPPSLSQKWSTMPASARLGKIDIGSTKDHLGNPVPKITDEEGEEYVMNHVKPASLYVMEKQDFSNEGVKKEEGSEEEPEKELLSITGTVESMFHMRPNQMKAHLSRTRKISKVSNTVLNKTKRTDLATPESKKRIEVMVRNQNIKSAEDRRLEKLLREREKAVKGDRAKVEKLLLSLYEKKAYWTFKELKEETKQPEEHLRSILKEIAEYIPSGEHRNKWQLKKEYRTHAPQEEEEEWEQ